MPVKVSKYNHYWKLSENSCQPLKRQEKNASENVVWWSRLLQKIA